MMTLDEVLSNQFVGLLSSLVLPKRLQVSGEKDLQMPDSVKKDIMKKLVFTADIGKDLHGIGPRLMNQGSVQFTRDALEV
ncbi:hypothetical protein IJM86_05700 [bacterium]|nr:hypothetical protein [bacterium]